MKYLLLFCAMLLSGLASAQPLTAPTQGAEVSVDSVTATSMYVSFANQSGNGQGRLVAIALAPGGQPVPLTPTNNTFYPVASPVFGQGTPLAAGYVVHNGPGHSVVVTGLVPNTFYYLTASEWNASGSGILYNNGGTSTSTSTLADVPLATAPTTDRLVQVYPNPTSGRPVQLLLQGYAGATLALRLTDMLGRTVLERPLPALNKQHVEPLPTLAPGAYLLTISGSGAPVQKRLLVSQ